MPAQGDGYSGRVLGEGGISNPPLDPALCMQGVCRGRAGAGAAQDTGWGRVFYLFVSL